MKKNENILAIGDNIRTDIVGDNKMNFESLFITGCIHIKEFFMHTMMLGINPRPQAKEIISIRKKECLYVCVSIYELVKMQNIIMVDLH